MKFLIYNINDLILFYLRKDDNLIFEYEDFKDIDIDHVIINVKKIKDIPPGIDNKKFKHVTIISEENSQDFKNFLFFYIKPEKSVIDNIYNTREIYGTKTNFTILHEAIPKMIEIIKKSGKGHYNILNHGYVNVNSIIDFFDIKNVKIIPENFHVDHIKVKMSRLDNYYIHKKWIINVYIPTYYRFNKTKRSIESILNIAKNSIHDVKVYIGDNNTKIEEMNNWLKSLDTDVFFSKENLGKSVIINKLHKNSRKSDFIFSIDSDMYSKKDVSYNILDKMIDCLLRGDNIGLVSSNQYECCEHWFGRGIINRTEREMKFGYSTTGIGISGGCICMRSKDWESVGMYQEDYDIYTADDAILTYNVVRKLGKTPVIAIDYGMNHPGKEDDDDEYIKWKQESFRTDGMLFIKDNHKGKNKKGFYD